MNPTTEIVEELFNQADNDAAAWIGNYKAITIRDRKLVQSRYKERIPLLELLEVARAANSNTCRHSADKDGTTCETCVALSKLKEKLPEI